MVQNDNSARRVGTNWFAVRDGDPRARGLFNRHYSAMRYRNKRPLKLVGPGEYMLLMTKDCLALFAWRKGHDSGYRWHGVDAQTGVCCTVFRNESNCLSSALIREACDLAWQKWPQERLFTYVDPHKISSTNPGYCFLQAGWRRYGTSPKGLAILELHQRGSPAFPLDSESKKP